MEDKYKLQPIDIVLFALAAIAVVAVMWGMVLLWGPCYVEEPDVFNPEPSEEVIEDIVEETAAAPVVSVDRIVVDAEVIDLASTEPATLTEPVETVLYFDVPLSEDLQDHIFAVCEEYRIEPSVVIAMIQRESGFRDWVKGDNGNSYGLMQIQKKWHGERMERLGVTDLLDPYQNVLVGIDILAELFGRYDDIEWVLMAYNGGASYANNLAERGIVSSYATGVIESARELRSEINA